MEESEKEDEFEDLKVIGETEMKESNIKGFIRNYISILVIDSLAIIIASLIILFMGSPRWGVILFYYVLYAADRLIAPLIIFFTIISIFITSKLAMRDSINEYRPQRSDESKICNSMMNLFIKTAIYSIVFVIIVSLMTSVPLLKTMQNNIKALASIKILFAVTVSTIISIIIMFASLSFIQKKHLHEQIKLKSKGSIIKKTEKDEKAEVFEEVKSSSETEMKESNIKDFIKNYISRLVIYSLVIISAILVILPMVTPKWFIVLLYFAVLGVYWLIAPLIILFTIISIFITSKFAMRYSINEYMPQRSDESKICNSMMNLFIKTAIYSIVFVIIVSLMTAVPLLKTMQNNIKALASIKILFTVTASTIISIIIMFASLSFIQKKHLHEQIKLKSKGSIIKKTEKDEKAEVFEEVKSSSETEVEESNISGFIGSYILNSILFYVVLRIVLGVFVGFFVVISFGALVFSLSGNEEIKIITMSLMHSLISVITLILVAKFATKTAIKNNGILPKDEHKIYNILISIFVLISIIGILISVNKYDNTDVKEPKYIKVGSRSIRKTEEQIMSEAKTNLLLSVGSNLASFGILAVAQKNYLHKQIEIKNTLK